MTFPATELHAAIVTALTGITVGAVAVPVRAGVSPKTAVPYIAVGGIRGTGWDTKQWRGAEITADIDAWTSGNSITAANTLANAIASRLIDTTLTMTGYTLVYSELGEIEIIQEEIDPTGRFVWHVMVEPTFLIQPS